MSKRQISEPIVSCIAEPAIDVCQQSVFTLHSLDSGAKLNELSCQVLVLIAHVRLARTKGELREIGN